MDKYSNLSNEDEARKKVNGIPQMKENVNSHAYKGNRGRKTCYIILSIIYEDLQQHIMLGLFLNELPHCKQLNNDQKSICLIGIL